MVSVYGLTIGYQYHYVFAVSYDALDGNDAKSYILSEGDIKTSSPIYLKNVSTTTNSISFGIANEGSDARLDSLVLIGNPCDIIVLLLLKIHDMPVEFFVKSVLFSHLYSFYFFTIFTMSYIFIAIFNKFK